MESAKWDEEDEEYETKTEYLDEDEDTKTEYLDEEDETKTEYMDEDEDTKTEYLDEDYETQTEYLDEDDETKTEYLDEEDETKTEYLDEEEETKTEYLDEEDETKTEYLDEEDETKTEYLEEESSEEYDTKTIYLDDIDPMEECEEAQRLEKIKNPIIQPFIRKPKEPYADYDKVQEEMQMQQNLLVYAQYEKVSGTKLGVTKEKVSMYRCKSCKTYFDNILIVLKEHIGTTEHRSKLDEICPTCCRFSRRQKMTGIAKMCSNHTIKVVNSVTKLNKMFTRVNIYKCTVCAEVYKNLDDFRKHQKTHKGYSLLYAANYFKYGKKIKMPNTKK